jgi:DNA-binding NtrC family response regulator
MSHDEPKAARRSSPPARILVVDHDDGSRSGLEQLLRASGLTVVAAKTAIEALAAAAANPVALLVTDVRLADCMGDNLAAEVLCVRPAARVIYTSCEDAPLVAVPGIVIEKPIDPDAFLFLVARFVSAAP